MNLRILSYNMHRAIGLDRRFRLERIIRILDHYDADIVLLQEVDVGVPRSQRLNLGDEIAKQLKYPYHAIGLNVKLRNGMYGNATLSRFPIVDERNIDLTIGFRKSRGCLFTRLELPEAKSGWGALGLAVFNLHLGLVARERLQQLELLFSSTEFLKTTSSAPCLVAGDFNDWRTVLTPIFIDRHSFKCATDHGSHSRKPMLTFPSFAPAVGLDKIFCRGEIESLHSWRCRLMVSKVASDHLPVIADLQLLINGEHPSAK
nr:endonuclease/exonuclease/phosphatase family protein [Desulfobulbaceae bacterium]